MKRLYLALCGLALLAVSACEDKAAGRTPLPASTTTNSRPAPATTNTSAKATGSTAAAKATVEVDGLLFVGADKAKVGDTIKVAITNQTSGALEVRLLDPTGQTSVQAQVAGNGSGEISAVATTAGPWKVTFAGATIGTGFDKVITVA